MKCTPGYKNTSLPLWRQKQHQWRVPTWHYQPEKTLKIHQFKVHWDIPQYQYHESPTYTCWILFKSRQLFKNWTGHRVYAIYKCIFFKSHFKSHISDMLHWEGQLCEPRPLQIIIGRILGNSWDIHPKIYVHPYLLINYACILKTAETQISI